MKRPNRKERKEKRRIAIKEFNYGLLNLVRIQNKMGKIYSINEQQVIKKIYIKYMTKQMNIKR